MLKALELLMCNSFQQGGQTNAYSIITAIIESLSNAHETDILATRGLWVQALAAANFCHP